MRLLRTLIVFALCWLVAAPALAEKRVALVIGNGAYKHAPALANPKNDAEGMAASLKRLGFEVLAGTDLEKGPMERLLRDFAQKIDGADVALVFYAGHGLQVHGRNYFVPVDSKLERESDLDFEAVPLELVQRVMEQGTRTNIIVLDACRDNPLARNLARSMGTRSVGIGRGLGQTQAGVGTLIVYATQPGNVALDGQEKNSPFTEALLKHIEAPGLEVRLVVSRVRQAVIAATKGKQVPWDSSSLIGEVYLAAKPAAPGATPPAPETKPPASTPPAATDTPPRGPAPDQETVFWQSIKDSKNAADFKAYLEKHPNGTFAALVKIRLAEIEKAAAVTPPAPPPEKPAPQPASPGPPRRTTSMISGQDILGDQIPGAFGLASAQACASLCIARPQCVAWMYWTDKHALNKRACYLYGKASPGTRYTSAEIDRYGGFVRTTPAAAQPPAAKPQSGTTPAPTDQQSLIRELMRKSVAAEAENGFCARTGWPVISYTASYSLAVRPGTHVYRTQDVCAYIRVGPVTSHPDAKIGCAVAAHWSCESRRGCTHTPASRYCE